MDTPPRQHQLAITLAVVAMVLSGCGRPARDVAAGDQTRDATSTTTTAATARRDGSRPTRRPDHPPNPPRSVPTRLVGGPVVLRVEGGEHPRGMRYVLVFRLNRPYPKWPKDPENRHGPAPLPRWADSALGNFAIDEFQFDFADSVFNFDASVARSIPDRDNCFIGVIYRDVERPWILPRLDAIPDGGRVRVRLRPLTPKRDGTPQYGRVYVRHPRIVRARVSGTNYLTIRSPAALAVLRSTGCFGTVLY
jgi:hypothetical protein